MGKLNKEYLTPDITHVNRIWTHSIGALTPDKLTRILRNAGDGDFEDYITLAEDMEETDPHFASVLRTRKAAATNIPIIVQAATDSKLDQLLADEIRELISNPEFKSLIDSLLDAISKGFSICEIIWNFEYNKWKPVDYIWRDQRYFMFDRNNLTQIRIKNNTSEGLILPNYKFITHIPKLKTGIPIKGGLARLISFSYMVKRFTIQNWVRFIEVFGMPLRIGRYGAGVKTEDKQILYNAVRDIAFDAAAILPDSMRIEFQEITQSNNEVFINMANFIDTQISKAVIGQTMTSDSGSSRAQAEVHDIVRKDIAENDSIQLVNTINKDLITPYIINNYGVQKRYPKIISKPEKQEDLNVLTNALTKLVPLGLKVQESVIRDRFNIPDPDPGADILFQQQQEKTQVKKALNRSTPFNVDYIVNVLEKNSDPEIRTWINTLQDKLQNSVDLSEFQNFLNNESFNQLSTTKLKDDLTQGMILADLIGRSEV